MVADPTYCSCSKRVFNGAFELSSFEVHIFDIIDAANEQIVIEGKARSSWRDTKYSKLSTATTSSGYIRIFSLFPLLRKLSRCENLLSASFPYLQCLLLNLHPLRLSRWLQRKVLEPLEGKDSGMSHLWG